MNIYHILSDHYQVESLGAPATSRQIGLPVRYHRELSRDQADFYLAESTELSDDIPPDSLVVCWGPAPQPRSVPDYTLLYLPAYREEPAWLMAELREIYDRLLRWSYHARRIIMDQGSVAALVEASIPFWDNRIIVSDQDLNIIAYCESDGQKGSPIQLRHDCLTIPESIFEQVVALYPDYMSRREPFIVPVDMDGRTVRSYCVNLYRDQSYIGCCSLSEDHHELLASDCDLFAYFAEVCTHLFSVREAASERSMGLRAAFRDLLNGTSGFGLELKALTAFITQSTGIPQEFLRWRSLYVYCLNETVPYEYAAAKLEEVFPFCYAFRNGNIIRAIALDREEQTEENRQKTLTLCQKMDLMIGISRPFSDLTAFPSYCALAKDLVVSGYSAGPGKRLFLFQDEITNLIINSSLHKYPSRMLSSDALDRLFREPVLWTTLKAYLDNECNASRTANQLFLHRSTLTHRLEKIRQSVQLDTPDQRLYARLCIRLRETEDKMKGQTNPAAEQRGEGSSPSPYSGEKTLPL